MKFLFGIIVFPAVLCALRDASMTIEKFGENDTFEAALLQVREAFSVVLQEYETRIKKLEEQSIMLSGNLQRKDMELEALQKMVEELRRHSFPKAQLPDVKSYTNEENPKSSSDGLSYFFSNRTIEERLENLELLSTLRSCYEYSMFGISNSGTFSIDPDGPLRGNEPFDVYCRFENGEAITEIIHDKDGVVDISPCADPFCYSLELSYPTTMEQITAIKDISESCTQDITFGCFLSGLSANDVPIGEWINQNGDPEIYFSGSNHNTHICECGVHGNCSGSEENYVCNCDNQIPVVQEDAGTITDMSALPIIGFKYGMMAYESQIATIKIGRLQCRGQKEIDPSLLMESCQNMKTQGIMTSGHYVLNDHNIVFCDMSRQISDSQIQRHVGLLSYNDVMFLVERTEIGYVPTDKILFQSEQIDNGNNFNTAEGTFFVPKDGLYVFSFNGYSYPNSDSRIDVYVNGELLREFSDSDADASYQQVTFFFSIELKKNDELYISNLKADTFQVYTGRPMTFMGRLME